MHFGAKSIKKQIDLSLKSAIFLNFSLFYYIFQFDF